MPSRRIEIHPQPDNVTCGPTCLHAVYCFYDDDTPLEDVIESVDTLETGGTLAVHLAQHALRRGYRATLYTYNLQLFDPTWFAEGTQVDLPQRLADQAVEKRRDRKLVRATEAYLDYLQLGGTICFEDLSPSLLGRLLSEGRPVLTGLSATYLYRCARERNDDYDDVRGEPTGHFVVLTDVDDQGRVHVADPLRNNPAFDRQHYSVDVHRLIGSILLGMVTYDANLLLLEPASVAR